MSDGKDLKKQDENNEKTDKASENHDKKEKATAKEEKIEKAKNEEQEKPKTVIEEAVQESKEQKKSGKKSKSAYAQIKKGEIKPGMVIRVHQKIVDTNAKGEEKERIQVFQGMVISHKHGSEPGATITVRKVSGGIGVEKIFPLNMPSLAKFELVRKYKVKQARPYYLKTYKKRLSEIKD